MNQLIKAVIQELNEELKEQDRKVIKYERDDIDKLYLTINDLPYVDIRVFSVLEKYDFGIFVIKANDEGNTNILLYNDDLEIEEIYFLLVDKVDRKKVKVVSNPDFELGIKEYDTYKENTFYIIIDHNTTINTDMLRKFFKIRQVQQLDHQTVIQIERRNKE